MNPFPDTNLPVNMKGPVQAEQPKRYGIMRARVGADFPVRCKDGKMRAFRVRDLETLRRRVEEVRKDKTEKHQPHWLCFSPTCRSHKWETEEALLADHPDLKVMVEQQEIHVIALCCEAPELMGDALVAWWDNERSEVTLRMGPWLNRPDIANALAHESAWKKYAHEPPVIGLLIPS